MPPTIGAAMGFMTSDPMPDSLRITLDVYTQAVSSNKRAAQSKVVKMMVPNLGEMKDEKHSQNGR